MSRQANVRSIDAIRRFRIALREYSEAVQDVLTQLQLETQRTLDWVHDERLSYWPRQVRLARDTLSQAQTVLEVKSLTLDGSQAPSCHEEREAVARARRRLRYAEDQVSLLRRMLPQLRQQADAYRAVLGKLAHLVESDLPAAMANLERMIAALERYAIQREPPPSGDPSE